MSYNFVGPIIAHQRHAETEGSFFQNRKIPAHAAVPGKIERNRIVAVHVVSDVFVGSHDLRYRLFS